MTAMLRVAGRTVVVGLLVLVWAAGAAAQDGEPVSAKIWLGHEAEIEE